MTTGDSVEELRAALLPRYQLGDELGRGGMAVVYSARRADDGVAVAIKVLRRELAAAIGTRRFLREIEIERAVRHPRIVPVLDAGEAGGVPYYVMPLIHGESLRHRLEHERQLPLPVAVAIGAGVADALAAAHAAGIVHRDIKPENILLDGDDPVVSDFGVARAVQQAAGDRLTDSGLAIGTPSYMSPEQGSGTSEIDARTDIYSIGCVLYEMLAGTPPFSGPTSQAIVARHMQEPPPPLYIVRPGLPADLEEIVRRCLAKVPADRFARAADVATALRAVDLAHPAPPVDVVEGRRRRRGLVQWGVAGAAVLALGVAGLRWLRPPLDPNRVVVFPLNQVGGAEGEGERAAFLVGSALEHTEPMKWLDGWSLLPAAERQAGVRLDPGTARRLARAQRARYYLSGTIARGADSLRVTLELHDLAQGNLEVRETAAAPLDSALARPVLAATVRLLPRLSSTDRQVDVSSLLDRRPAAILNWLQGERAYRAARFEEALDLTRRAVEADSELAPAALRAAVAASWTEHADEARNLAATTIRHAAGLSPRDRAFADGLNRYVRGDANGAIRAIRRTLALDPEHRDAWMLLGEVHLHLMPDITLDSQFVSVVPPPIAWPVDSLAGNAFRRAFAIDSGFTPALQHLIEIELRRGRVEAARRYLDRFVAGQPDPALVRRVRLQVECAERDPARIDWGSEARADRHDLATTGAVLLGSAVDRVRRCGVAALQAVLGSDSAGAGDKWGALMALHGALVGSGHQPAALHLVDSAVAGGMDPALSLYVMEEIAGYPVGERAGKFVNDLRGAISARGAPSLWLLGSWAAVHRDAALLGEAMRALEQRRDSTRSRRDSLLAAAVHARVTLAGGDTSRALVELAALHPSAPREELAWSVWEPLAAERLLYARLLLTRREFATALRVADDLDHPTIMIQPTFLAESLQLRAELADSAGRPGVARLYRQRLQSLRGDAP